MTKARDLASAPVAPSTVSSTELGYVDGVTSAIQTQINAKAAYPTQTGNSGKYLTTDGTNPSWGDVITGGKTLISTTTLSGSITTIPVPSTYKDVVLVVRGISCSTNSDVSFKYNSGSLNGQFNGVINKTSTYALDTSWPNIGIGNNVTGGNTNNSWYLEVIDYNSTGWKPTRGWATWNSASGAGFNATNISGFATDAAAVTQLQILTSSGTFSAGTAYLYGIK